MTFQSYIMIKIRFYQLKLSNKKIDRQLRKLGMTRKEVKEIAKKQEEEVNNGD